ncbi:MAG TPA: c-type cytochrome [Devosia sp.]|jgi:cytochrome c|nr:c-type cytochrome [Devosia sp.]
MSVYPALAGALFLSTSLCTAGPVGEAARGAAIYERCLACHALAYDRTGPRHCGLIGRKAASVPGFPYSPALRASGIVWNRAALDAFLRSPMTNVPGTSMGYAGIPNDQERADLIAWLQLADSKPECKALK